MKSRILLVCGIVALTLAFAWPARSAPGDDAVTRIGTCNILKVINGIKEYQDVSKQIKADYDKIQVQIDDRAKKVKDMQEQLGVYKPDSQAYVDKNKELSNAKVELEAWVKEQQMEGDRKQKEITKSLWDKVHAKIGDVAKARGFNLIVADQSTEIPKNIADPNLQINVLNAILLQRTVLFSDDRLDLTQDVIAAMDKDYVGAGH